MSSKSELTKTIESQQAKISRLEESLTGIVTAYKNLKKEKEALESTLRVLSTSATESTVTSDNEANTTAKEGNESGNETETSQTTMHDKLQILQQNLGVITDQKNRMEQMFQSDKRKLKLENDELKHSLEEAKAENIVLKEKFDNEIKDLKKTLRQCQHDQERETANHGVMVREFQTLLTTERNKSETFEQQFDESRAKIVTLENQFENLKKQYNNLNIQYQTKLNESKEKDLIASDELKHSKEKISELISLLKTTETKHAEQLRIELKRNEQLEKQLNEIRQLHDRQLTTNETRHAELSEQIGIIEKQRAQDQQIIQKLKERIAQLDIENSLLTKASSTSEIENEECDLDTLLKRISKLKVLIRIANDRFGQSLTIEDILNIDREISSGSSNLSSENTKILHNKCHEEIERLKTELDKYKNKTLAAFKAKTFKDTTSTKEIDDLRNQIDQLREKLSTSQTLYNTENQRHNQVVEKLELCLTNIREQHRQEIEQILSKKRVELNELESELEKQRERTLRLLVEKDREIETLKTQLQTSVAPPTDQSSSTIIQEFFPHMSTSTIGGPMTAENNLLYFIQDQQFREQELISLRRQRHELEATIRDLQQKYSFEINELQQVIEQLKDDIEHMKLTTQRNENYHKNEHNIDYIKNVFYHYLLANDTQVKQTMANALMTILHFSSKEKAKIESFKPINSLPGSSWFNSK